MGRCRPAPAASRPVGARADKIGCRGCLLASGPGEGDIGAASGAGARSSAMIGYLIRRVIQAVIVVIGVCLITFILYHLFPGGSYSEARIILGPRATTAPDQAVHPPERARTSRSGRSSAILVGHVFTFNLGYSYKLNEPVATIVLQKLPKTVLLARALDASYGHRRHPARHLPGAAAQQALGLRPHDALVHLLCDADLLPRHRAHRGLRHPLAPLPARGAAVGRGRADPRRLARRSSCRCSPSPRSTSRASAATCAPR